jgi:hypothetical protein
MGGAMVMRWAVVRWGLLLAAVGCGKHLNAEWCAQSGHTDPACPDAGGASSTSCTTDRDCADTPCLPDRTCALPDATLYASPSPTGTGSACTSAARCGLATAIQQVKPGRDIIWLAPGGYVGAVVIDHSVRIIGQGATLEGASAGAAVTVTNSAVVELDYVSISGASSASGISCAGATLTVHAARITSNQQGITSACTLTVDRTVISDNSDGALAVTTGTINIRNNFIVNNGNPMLARTANVTIAASVTGSFTFNTVAYNDAKQNGNPGVDCSSTNVTADGNIVTDNTHKGVFNVDPQVTGVCNFTRSFTLPGQGANDLFWANPAASDFHLTAASTAVLDSPMLMCDGQDDFDGQARPKGGGCDFGADELMP